MSIDLTQADNDAAQALLELFASQLADPNNSVKLPILVSGLGCFAGQELLKFHVGGKLTTYPERTPALHPEISNSELPLYLSFFQWACQQTGVAFDQSLTVDRLEHHVYDSFLTKCRDLNDKTNAIFAAHKISKKQRVTVCLLAAAKTISLFKKDPECANACILVEHAFVFGAKTTPAAQPVKHSQRKQSLISRLFQKKSS